MTFEVPIEITERLLEFENFQMMKLSEMVMLARPRLVLEFGKLDVNVGETKKVEMKNVSLAWGRWNVSYVGSGVKVVPARGVIIPGTTAVLNVKAVEYSGIPVTVALCDEQGPLGFVEVRTIRR
jgi:hypothetical protein